MFVGLAFGLYLSNSLPEAFIAGLLGIVGAWIPDLDLRFKHRKFLHNLFAITGFTLIIYGLLEYFSINNILPPKVVVTSTYAFFSGYGLHLLFDSLTKRGVFILYPLSEKFRIRIPLFKSRSIWGNGFAIGFGLLIIYFWINKLGYIEFIEKLTSYLSSISP